MDNNIGRAYMFLAKNQWKHPRLRYFRYHRSGKENSQWDHSRLEEVSNERRGQKTITEEDEECLQSSPLPHSTHSYESSEAREAEVIFKYQRVPLQEPKDQYNLVYLGLIFAGVGFLLPYNSFVIAVDFFQHHYPGTTIIFDMSCIYIIFAFVAVSLNNLVIESISLFWRINVGYILSLVTLLLIAGFEIATTAFSENTAYNLNLAGIGIVAFGCTIQQSSFYGYTSMLPKRYTQAVMTGESAAGLIVSTNRILTKLLWQDERVNTLLFFGLSIIMIAFCILIHNLLQRTDFVKFYIQRCSRKNEETTKSNKINQEAGTVNTNDSPEDFTLIDYLETDYRINGSDRAFISLSSSAIDNDDSSRRFFAHSDSTEFEMPFGIDEEDIRNYVPPKLPESSNRTKSSILLNKKRQSIENEALLDKFYDLGESFTTETNSKSGQDETSDDQKRTVSSEFQPHVKSHKIFAWPSFLAFNLCETSCCEKMRQGLKTRLEIARKIWPHMIAIMMAYFVTLTLFPGIESEIINCDLASWMPVLLMTAFNLLDFFGKIVASFFYEVSSTTLAGLSYVRLIFIPLFILCASPREKPFFSHIFWPFFFSCLLGLTNGIIGSLPMILAPLKVSENARELTGNLMTFSYSLGLVSGSFFSYFVDHLIGSPDKNPNLKCDLQLRNSSYSKNIQM